MTIIEMFKDILGITVADYDYIFVIFGCMVVFTGLLYIFALLTVPINMITNAFKKQE